MSLGRRLLQPFIHIGSVYNSTAKRWPLGTGVVTTVLKTSAADLFAQKVVERKEDIDWRRNGLFTFFGFAYLGCFQYWLYNDLFVRMCRPITAAVGHYGAAPVKTFIDQCIHHPLCYFPAFYVLKGSVEGRSLNSSLEKYQVDMWENCKALWMVWVPAQLVNFAYVPQHLRIPFVAGVSFAWTVIISVMRGSLDCHEDPAEVPLKEMHHAPHTTPATLDSTSAVTPASSHSLPHGPLHEPAFMAAVSAHDGLGSMLGMAGAVPAAALPLAGAATE
ncbi:hypothetical protein QJQ45_019552 [Haematococcus lacustris]|nr:hypothetical protein QJQ45_019552 [Haematococcus lacustris]